MTLKEMTIERDCWFEYAKEYQKKIVQLETQNAEYIEVLREIYLHHLPNHTEGNPLIKRLEELLK